LDAVVVAAENLAVLWESSAFGKKQKEYAIEVGYIAKAIVCAESSRIWQRGETCGYDE